MSTIDSPAALIAWMYSKFHRWSDDYPWTKDEIITWVMLHYMGQGPAGTVRLYREIMAPYLGQEERVYVATTWSNVPLGISQFRKEGYVLPLE